MDITSLLGNVMDKDMLEKISKSAKVSTADVSNVLKNAAPSVMKHLDGDSDVAAGRGLVAPRVMLCAAHEALTVLRILAGEYDV